MLDSPSSTGPACLLLAQFLSEAEPQEGQVPWGFTVWGEPSPRGRVESGGRSSLRSSASYKFNGKILAVAGWRGQGQHCPVAGAWDVNISSV